MDKKELCTDDLTIIKKNGLHVKWNPDKILIATGKSAARVLVTFSDEEKDTIVKIVTQKILDLHKKEITIDDMHAAVEAALDVVNPAVAKSYRNFRDYKATLNQITEGVITEENRIRYLGDKSNANKDAKLVATKRSLIYGEWATRMYEKFHLTPEELEAATAGYIYIHDKDSRADTMNCFDRSTRFITDRGVMSFYDFTDGDEVMVISHTGKWRKAVVHSYGWQQIQKVTFKRANGKTKEVLVTPNHRWILKDGSETTNLKVGDKLFPTPNITVFDWDLLSRSDKKIWCLGFAFADGSVVNDNNIPTMHLRLCGAKKEYAQRFIDVGYSVTQPSSLNGDMMVRMQDIHSKEFPYLQLNYKNIRYFINGYLKADGNKNLESGRSSEFRSVQVTGDFNDYIYNLLNMSGYYVTNISDITDQVTNYGKRTKTTKTYQLYSDCGDRTWVVSAIEDVSLNPKAQVWCLEVEEDHSFLLENGIPTGNCCLFDMKTVMSGGFEMGNMWYNEPNSLDTAFDVMGDIILATAAQQYGGFTVPEVDTLLEPYAEKSYKRFFDEFISIAKTAATLAEGAPNDYSESMLYEKADEYAMKRLYRECEQGMQGIEYKLNTVGSSRGDYPFTTFTFGLAKGPIGRMIAKVILRVRRKGQGKKGFEKPVLFPKLVLLYDEELHGPGGQCEDVFDEAVICSSKTMYPDYLSLTGEGYVPSMYKKYGKAISPMGCRAFLSPWYERGGMTPADENDQPVFIGRFNLGVVTLHLPMILQKARVENRDFYEVLDYYMEMIRGIHKRTIDYLGNMEASSNPTAYCEGGFYGGHLKPTDKIASILKPCTISFGVTALNELQMLYNGKSIREDGRFAMEVMEHINAKIAEYKEADGILYATYGTPAETLCFAGYTEVQTYEGIKKIKDITTNDLVYSFNETEHKVELKKVIGSYLTKKNAEVVKVTFTNGQEIVCTPEHPFAVRKPIMDEKHHITGEMIEYVMAKDLKPNTRIKSNYIAVNHHGRPTTSICYNGRKQLIQDINAEYFYGPKPTGFVTHHIDENKENNTFENLVYMKDAEHRRTHIDNISQFCYTSESQHGKKNSFYGKHHTEETRLADRLSHIGKSLERFDMNYQHIEHYECADDAEKAGYTRHLVKLACNGEREPSLPPHYYKESYWYYTEDCQQLMEANHKVKSVEYLNETCDVYDIQVEDNHNFFVGGKDGILVHNCGKQIDQFRAKYGVIEGVSSREYTTNSFHDAVWEEITPIEKQNDEMRFFDLFRGGRIQYCRYPVQYNKMAIKTLVRRAMKMGFYEGVNLELSYCNHCGHQEVSMDVCPHCGSKNITSINRMNGYLGYSRVGTVDGDYDFDSSKDTGRFNKAKQIEFSERRSM